MTTRHGTASPAGTTPAGARPAALRILITGSRTWRNATPIAAELDARLEALPSGGTLTVVVGYDPERRYPPGVDEIVYEYCESTTEFVEREGKTLAVETHPAHWQAPCRAECDHGPRPVNRRGQEYCPAAGTYRDAEMVHVVAAAMAEAGTAAECLAFIEPCAKPRCRKPRPHGSHGATHTADLADKTGIPTRYLRATTCRPVSPCPACSGTKAPRQYLCRGCWFTLQPAARRALNKRDGLAARRLSELLEQLRTEVPLHRIVITP